MREPFKSSSRFVWERSGGKAVALLFELRDMVPALRELGGYMPAIIASLWIGKVLGDIEIASLQSFHRLGHPFVLYTYSKISNVPNFVEVRDASEILPANRIVRHWQNGSPALHSDLFRYALMQKTQFIWADLDIIALREFVFPAGYIFAWESSDFVGNAVLRVPKGSATLRELLVLNETTKGIPPHLKGMRKLKYSIRDKLAGGLSIERWPWGATGPQLLTKCLKESGEIVNALPVNTFYSVPLSDAWKFCEPMGFNREQATSDAYAVHVWANVLRPYVKEKYDGKFPKESFIMQEAAENS